LSPTARPGRRPDIAATRLWVTAVGLLGQAEEALARGSILDFTSSLIVADTATEAVLGLLASDSPTPSKAKEAYEAWLQDAALAAGMNKGLVTEIRNVHELRNQAAHNGYEAHERDAERATQVAREVLGLVPLVLERFGRLASGAGVASAVASVIEPHPAASALVDAQLALSGGKNQAALEAISVAHYIAIASIEPSLPHLPTGPVGMRSTADVASQVLMTRLQPVEESIRAIERWLTPIALGIRPAEYSRLRRLLPLPLAIAQGLNAYHWPTEPEPDQARWAVERISTLILRLWESQSLTVSAFREKPPTNVEPGSLDRLLTTVVGTKLQRGLSHQLGASVVVRPPTGEVHSFVLIVDRPGVTFAGADVIVTASGWTGVKSRLLTPSELEIAPTDVLPGRAGVGVTDIRFTVTEDAILGSIPTKIRIVHADGPSEESMIAALGSVVVVRSSEMAT
jgi:hypothetical protein